MLTQASYGSAELILPPNLYNGQEVEIYGNNLKIKIYGCFGHIVPGRGERTGKMSDSDIQMLTARIDNGFAKVYKKIDDLRQDFSNHRIPCTEKFAILEMKSKLPSMDDDDKGSARDYWKYVIRTAIVVMTGGVMAMAWKLFLGNIDKIKG